MLAKSVVHDRAVEQSELVEVSERDKVSTESGNNARYRAVVVSSDGLGDRLVRVDLVRGGECLSTKHINCATLVGQPLPGGRQGNQVPVAGSPIEPGEGTDAVAPGLGD